jgi:hypothetical protein
MDSRLRLSSKSLIGESSGMTNGGGLRLSVLDHTLECINYITELTVSELTHFMGDYLNEYITCDTLY